MRQISLESLTESKKAHPIGLPLLRSDNGPTQQQGAIDEIQFCFRLALQERYSVLSLDWLTLDRSS